MAAPELPTRAGTMRERNLALVLAEIARRQPVTRARLAESTGLTKTTVAAQVAVLERLRLVEGAQPVREGSRGRPGAPISLARGPVAALGLEVNGHYLAACVVDPTGAVRLRDTVAGDNRGRDPGETLAALGALARRLTARGADIGLDVVGTAVALPGVRIGDRVNAPNLGWDAVPAAALLAGALPDQRLELVVDNEANLGALGELRYGAGQGAGSYLYLSGETGIGAGLVVDGDLFRGAHGAAGELGHVVVDPDGPVCGCGGAGCLEQYAGLDAVMRAAGVSTVAGTPARVGEPGDGPAATSASRVAELLDRLGREDRQAHLAVERAGRGLGIALIGAVNLLDPDTVVLGGVHARLADHLIPPIEAALTRGGGRLRGRVPTVRASALGSESAVRGAAATVLAQVFADPLAIG